jgi:hypothetical protein
LDGYGTAAAIGTYAGTFLAHPGHKGVASWEPTGNLPEAREAAKMHICWQPVRPMASKRPLPMCRHQQRQAGPPVGDAAAGQHTRTTRQAHAPRSQRMGRRYPCLHARPATSRCQPQAVASQPSQPQQAKATAAETRRRIAIQPATSCKTAESCKPQPQPAKAASPHPEQ